MSIVWELLVNRVIFLGTALYWVGGRAILWNWGDKYICLWIEEKKDNLESKSVTTDENMEHVTGPSTTSSVRSCSHFNFEHACLAWIFLVSVLSYLFWKHLGSISCILHVFFVSLVVGKGNRRICALLLYDLICALV